MTSSTSIATSDCSMVSPASIGLCRRASGTSSATYFSPNSVLGRIVAVTFAGIVSRWSG